MPAYLAFVGGAGFSELEKGAATARVLTAALAFVLGFATVFILLGATATTASAVLARHFDVLGKIAGAAIVVMGLHYAGLFRLPFLSYEARFHPGGRGGGLPGAYVAGLAFAFGWTPCVGPVLAAILLVAGARESIGEGVALLAAYAAGLGLPFLAAAAAAPAFLRWAAGFRKHLRAVEVATGGLLVVTGAAIFLGSMPDAAAWLLDAFPALGRIG